MSFEWTPTRISVLIALWDEGIPTSAIGVKLGITKNAVVGKVHRLGLTKRGSPIKQKTQLVQVISLDTLLSGMCSWPEGEPGKDDLHFFWVPSISDKPYCLAHCERAYVKPSKERKSRAA